MFIKRKILTLFFWNFFDELLCVLLWEIRQIWCIRFLNPVEYLNHLIFRAYLVISFCLLQNRWKWEWTIPNSKEPLIQRLFFLFKNYAIHHLKYDTTHSPNVDTLVILRVQDNNFWSPVQPRNYMGTNISPWAFSFIIWRCLLIYFPGWQYSG